MSKITNEDVAESISIATLRMHDLVTDLYEALHSTDGRDVMFQMDFVLGNLQGFRRLMAEELSMIHEAIVQYREDNGVGWE